MFGVSIDNIRHMYTVAIVHGQLKFENENFFNDCGVT